MACVNTQKIDIPLHCHVGVYTLNLNEKHFTIFSSCSIACRTKEKFYECEYYHDVLSLRSFL